jgi:GTP pyrophosphokinase
MVTNLVRSKMVSTTNSLPIESPHDTLDIQVWVERIAFDRPLKEQQAMIEACQWAQQIHQTQNFSGVPYLVHVITVADILAQLGMDTEVLIAAILHDVNFDKQIRLDKIKKRFGINVMRLIDGLSKMKVIEELNDKSDKAINTKNQVESLRKMLLAMASDVRVVLIKLAERLDKMRLLRYQPLEKQRRMARETLDLFAPLANRLGIWQIKWELEDLSLRYLEPDTYKKMARLLDERRVDRENYIKQVMVILSRALLKLGIKADISGRPKHIYSIWRKMQRKNLDFEQIFDVRAVRVLVNTVNECYMVLGIIHNLWQPLRNEFDDYIANSKSNNYQSLHTAVIGPDKKIFEVQIRTHTMHHHAEFGVASHWRYKEGDNTRHDQYFEQKIAWLRQMLQWKDEENDANDFIDRFKSEIFEDRVYVLSPKGEVIDLPQGATPLDFAYHIHTQVGHCCRGAKVNNRLVPLTYTLKSGDLIEVLLAKEEKPSRDWLIRQAGYLKTSKARAKVKAWLKKQDNQQNISDGRTLFERILRRFNIKDCNFEHLAQKLRFQTVDELLASVGRGDTTVNQITKLFNEQVLSKTQPVLPTLPSESGSGAQKNIYVQGVGGLLTQTAGCCQPVPYDPIVGYITQGRGVMVHRCDCPNVLRWQDEGNQRLIEVQWSQSQTAPDPSLVYPVDIAVNAFDRPGLLRDICSILTNEKVNIVANNSSTDKRDNSVNMAFTLEVNNMAQLSSTLRKIDNLSNVMKVWRKT